MKRALYLGFLFILVVLKQRIGAASPLSPPPPPLCWVLEGGGGSALLTQRSKVILWPAFPGQVCGQACQVVRISVSACAVFMLECVRVCAHTYPGRLNSRCWKPICQLQHILPFIVRSQNTRSYFKLFILIMVTHAAAIMTSDKSSQKTLGSTICALTIQICVFFFGWWGSFAF